MAGTGEHFDIGAQRLGTLYAKALLAAAETTGATDALVVELDALLDEVLAVHPEFEKLLSSQMIAAEKKIAMLDRVLGGRISPLLLNFLKVVAEHGRLGSLRAIRGQLHQLHDELRGRVRVEVTTAVPLGSDSTDRLAEQIRAMLGRDPQLVTRTDADLIGGVLLRVGDTVFDGSLAAEFERLRGHIRQRSLQEIQAGRQAFID